jgi:putative flippase GtrA
MIATLSHYLIMVVAVELLLLQAAFASAIGALCGAVLAYLGNSYFTFNQPDSHRIAMLRFFLVASLGALFSAATVWFGQAIVGVHYLFSQLLATSLVLLGSYFLNRSWTFNYEKTHCC